MLIGGLLLPACGGSSKEKTAESPPQRSVHALSSAEESDTAMTVLRGIVYRIGNEPFTSLAIQDSAGIMHTIEKDTISEYRLLEELQGRTVEIHVRIIESASNRIQLERVRVIEE